MPRWVVHSHAAFSATHALTVYQGRAEEPHEHRWEVAMRVGTEGLNDEGFAIDFHEVHRLLADVIRPLRDCDLNQHPEIGHPTPSAERIAEVLAGHLQPAVADLGGRLLTISVWEGPENRVDLNLN